MSVWGKREAVASIIGTLADYVDVPFVPGSETLVAYLQTQYYYIHGASFIYPDKADPVELSAGNGAWDITGAKTEIIPVNTITKPFDLHWINCSGISGNGHLVIDIYSGLLGAEVLIGSIDIFRNAVQSQEGARAIQIPQQPANTRISCRLSDSTAGALTCSVKFSGHVYSNSLS